MKCYDEALIKTLSGVEKLCRNVLLLDNLNLNLNILAGDRISPESPGAGLISVMKHKRE